MRLVLRGLLVVVLLLLAAFGGLYFFFPAEVANFAIDAERGRAQLQRKELQIPGFRVVYLEGGQGEPLLLLHGIGADKDNWTRAARYLTPRYHVIAPDLPGFGESDKPDSASYHIADQVERVAAIAAALGLDHFDLGGNSMGGWIALAYAAAHREQVRSLWLLDPAGIKGGQPSEMFRRLKAGQRPPLFANSFEQFRDVLRFVFVRPPYVPGAVQRVIAKHQIENYTLNLRIFDEIRADLESTPLEQTLAGGLETPALIVWGERDRVLDVSSADILHKLLTHSQLIKLPDVGHLPMLETPKRAAQDYLRFRDSIAQAPPN